MTNSFPNFDAQTVASQGNAILGIRDSGKSYTAIKIAEMFFDAGIPFVAFDPIGRWRFMRVPGADRGYPVVVAGGMAADLPLTAENASQIVRAAMQAGISLVVDLYDINISKADWRRIVGDAVRVLLYENGVHGLRHIFIEEAAEFAPQRVGPAQGVVYAEIEKLARMGGNARLGYTLINQRAEEVNKAVLELCDNLFLHRQKGRNSLNALSKWLNLADVKPGSKEIIKSLPTMPQGQCWAWMAGSDRPSLLKVPTKNSFEPDRRAMRGDKVAITTAPVNVSQFVDDLRARLAGKPRPTAKVISTRPGEHVSIQAVLKSQEAEVKESEAKALRQENDQLRQRIAELELKLEMKPEALPPIDRSPSPAWENKLSVDSLVSEVLKRARTDDVLLSAIWHRPELQVRVVRQTIEVDDSTLRGQLAILISEKFFDTIATGNSAFNELKRRGKSVAKPSVYRECDKLSEMGFLTKESDGYRVVAGMKVNILEAA